MNEDDLRGIWQSHRTSHQQLRDHYRHLVFDVVDRIRTERSPSVHHELLILIADYALDDALESEGTLRHPAEEFEAFASRRMEHFVMDWLDGWTKLSNESGDAEDSTGDYQLTWSMRHERRFTSEVEASEAARSIPGMVTMGRPNGTWKIFEKGAEREVVLGQNSRTPPNEGDRPRARKKRKYRTK